MKWTYEICKEEALKYNTRKELQINNFPIYNKIKGKKWFELFNHMKTRKNWLYEECKIEALKYNTRKDLQINNYRVYDKIKSRKWFELYNHMETINIWTYEKCRVEALKYTTRKEMGVKDQLLYSAIRKNKWYELCDHMEIIGNSHKRLIYVYEFSDKSCYVGLTGNINIRKEQHLSDKESSVYLYQEKSGLIPNLVIKSDYILAKQASILEGIIVNDYKENGWNILNRTKTGNLGGNIIKWTYEKCKEEALKYNNITHLKSNNALYCALTRNKWLKELTTHIDRKRKVAN